MGLKEGRCRKLPTHFATSIHQNSYIADMKTGIKRIADKTVSLRRSKGYDPEKRIGALIKSGAIASAGRRAIAASFKKGLSVTVLENNVIYRLHPDGTKTVIKKLTPASKTYSSGKMLIK